MGTPKWALDYHGETQAARTVRLLGGVCDRVVRSVRPGPLDAGLPDVPAIADAVAVRGPAAGILSALDACAGAAVTWPFPGLAHDRRPQRRPPHPPCVRPRP